MVQAEFYTVSSSHHITPLVNFNADDKDAAEQWWGRTAPLCDHFFEISMGFSPMLTSSEIAATLMEMEMTRERIRKMTYPQQVKEARTYLMDAMSSVMVGFASILSGRSITAHDHTEEARQSLERFSASLETLGL